MRIFEVLKLAAARLLQRLREAPGRRLSLTRSGKVLLVITITVGFAAYNTGNNLLFFGWGALLSSIVISGVLSESTLRALDAHLEVPDELRVNASSPLPIRLDNESKRLPAFGVELRAHLHGPLGETITQSRFELRLSPKEGRQLLASFVPERRGLHALDRIEATTAYPFGFFLKSRYFWPRRHIDLVVFPARVEVSDLSRALVARLGEAPSHRPGMGDEFFSMRPYRPGDDPRRVMWRRAARTGRLVVRENEASQSRELLIDVCLPHGEETLEQDEAIEEAVALAGSLAEDLLLGQHAVGVRGPGTFVAPARGPRQRAAILTALGLLDAEAPVVDGAVSRRVARLAIVAAGAHVPAWADGVVHAGARAKDRAEAA